VGFIRSPERWLGPLGREGVTMTVAPNFGYAYARSRLHERDLTGFDFSRWRTAICGAERIDPRQLARFTRWLAPYGFTSSTFYPAYGLAEATLAVTGKPRGTAIRFVRLEQAALRVGAQVELEGRADIDELEGIGYGEGWISSCGRALETVGVKVVDDDGYELPPAHLGEIVVRGPSAARGYRGDDHATHERFRADGLHTADAGFILDDELFVVGRIADSIKVRGRSLYMEDLEARICERVAIKPGSYAVLSGVRAAEPVIAMIAELGPGDWSDRCAELLRSEAGGDARVEIYSSPRGSLLRTSSGKLRRRPMWAALVGGELQATRLAERPAARDRVLVGERA